MNIRVADHIQHRNDDLGALAAVTCGTTVPRTPVSDDAETLRTA